MRLRFFIFLLFMVATMARAAVPVYKNDTLTLLPTNMLRSNILDSATVIWTLGPNGTMTPTVIGGNASNAQPPSVNLTNWSTVSTQALRVAKTVFVSTNGNNSTGAREWTHLSFASPRWAKTNAVAGDTVWVWPGSYEANDLLKNGVNWHFTEGVTLYWTNTGAAGASGTLAEGAAIFDDRRSGACTSIISGEAVCVFRMTPTNQAGWNVNVTGGVVMTTNPATQLDIRLKRIEAIMLDINAYAAVWVSNCRKVRLDCDEIIDPWPQDTYWYENIGEFVFLATSTTALYWEHGEFESKVDRIKVTGYCLYGNDTSGPATTNMNWWHDSDLMDNTIIAGGLPNPENAIYWQGFTNLWVGWIHAKEIRSSESIFEMFGAGKAYLKADKLGGKTVYRASQARAGEVWITAQKASATTGKWVEVEPEWLGTNYIRIQHYEMHGTGNGFGFDIAGGTTFLQGGVAQSSTNGLLITNGTAQVEGMTIQTRGAANSWPVQIGGGTLILKDAFLVAPTGTTNTIYATTAKTVTGIGSVTGTTNENPNVTITSGSMSRRSGDGYWVSPSPIGTAGNNIVISGSVITLSTNLAITNRVIQKIQALAYSGTNVTIDLSQGNIFSLTATNNVKFWPTNGPGAGWSQQVIVHVDMDGTGGYSFYKDAVTSETNYTSLVLTNTANAKNTLFVSTDRTGTNFQFLVNPGFSK